LQSFAPECSILHLPAGLSNGIRRQRRIKRELPCSLGRFTGSNRCGLSFHDQD